MRQLADDPLPGFTAVVWMGNFDHAPTKDLVGSEAAGPVAVPAYSSPCQRRVTATVVLVEALKELAGAYRLGSRAEKLLPLLVSIGREVKNRIRAIDELEQKLKNAGLPPDAEKVARKELRRLRRENWTLREERDILKRAAAWFARETTSSPSKDSSS